MYADVPKENSVPITDLFLLVKGNLKPIFSRSVKNCYLSIIYYSGI